LIVKLINIYIIVSAPKSETNSKRNLEKTQSGKEPLEDSEPILEELIKQSTLELIPESGKSLKLAESLKSAELTKSVKGIEAETKSALKVKLMKESESVSIQESIQESVPKMEPIINQENIIDLEVPKKPVAQNVVANESIEAHSVSEKIKDENLQQGMLINFFITDITDNYYFISIRYCSILFKWQDIFSGWTKLDVILIYYYIINNIFHIDCMKINLSNLNSFVVHFFSCSFV